MDQAKLAHFRQRLVEMKQDIEHRIQLNYSLEEQMSDSIHEFAMYDNHPADIGSEMFEREKDLTLYSLDRETLKEIDQTLRRMEEGTYGICTVCGQPIPEERLEALPQAQTCKEHAPAPSIDLSRPAEEEYLYPPFGRSELDEERDENYFDGEDAWQIVAAWGTSNTPFAFSSNEKLDYNKMYEEAGDRDGYVEPVEQIGYTDIYGYHGPDSVRYMRSGTYEEYIHSEEGYGNFVDYEEYLRKMADEDGDT